MSKITRYSGNVVPFANNAQAGERFIFGSSTEQSNDLTTLVSANYLRGWGVVGPSDFPPLEWFNAQAFTSTQFIAYLHQIGIAEWNEDQEYHENSATNRNGVLYYCKTNDHVSATPPESDPTNWRKPGAEDVGYDNAASGLAATDVQGAIDKVGFDILTNQAYVGGRTIATGSAVFDNSDNSIELSGIGVGVEIGDVITITGSANNSKEFTLEEVVSNDKIIVNKAHAGGTTSKALVSEAATVTVKLLCKWYLAPTGLGQCWVNTLASRLPNTPYSAQPNRSTEISIIGVRGDAITFSIEVDGEQVSSYDEPGVQPRKATVSALLPHNSSYKVIVNINMITRWMELR